MTENYNHPELLFNEDYDINAKIKVIGVGGGGSNAVNQLVRMDKDDDSLEYMVFNTDSQALSNSCCPNKYVLGRNVTKGLGAGGNPEVGKAAAEDSYNDIQLQVKGADLVFIAAGEGGGTGTGAAPVVARAAKEAGALVLAIVTRPFNLEGKRKGNIALEGIQKLSQEVDALIVVSNDKLSLNKGSLGLRQAFSACDEILANSVKTVTDLIMKHGALNLDFADVKSILTKSGIALIGFGLGTGSEKAIEAAENAINSPLLESSIKGARSLLINFTLCDDTSLDDISNAIDYITEACEATSNDVYIKFGVQYDDSYKDKVKVAIIATNFIGEVNFDDQTSSRVTPAVKKPDIIKDREQSQTVQVMRNDKKESSQPDYLVDYLRKTRSASSAPIVPETDIEETADTSADIPVADKTVSIDVPVVMKNEDKEIDEEENDDDAIVVSDNDF